MFEEIIANLDKRHIAILMALCAGYFVLRQLLHVRKPWAVGVTLAASPCIYFGLYVSLSVLGVVEAVFRGPIFALAAIGVYSFADEFKLPEKIASLLTGWLHGRSGGPDAR